MDTYRFEENCQYKEKAYYTSAEQSRELLELLDDSTADFYEDDCNHNIIENQWFGMSIDNLRWSFLGLMEVLPHQIRVDKELYILNISKFSVKYEPHNYPTESYGFVFNRGKTLLEDMIECVKFVYTHDWLEFDKRYDDFRKKK